MNQPDLLLEQYGRRPAAEVSACRAGRRARLAGRAIVLAALIAVCGACYATPADGSANAAASEALPSAKACSGTLAGRQVRLAPELSGFGAVQNLAPLPLKQGEYVLTIDDGPSPGHIERILDILDEFCVKATFLMIGAKSQARPDLVKLAAQRGHGIGSHSMHHAALDATDLTQMQAEVLDGVAAVDLALDGRERSAGARRLFRTPGMPGWPSQHPDPAFRKFLADHGLVLAGIDASPEDWRNDPPEISFARLMKRLPDRGVILMHDWPPNSRLLLPMILQEIARRKGKIVSIAW